MFLKMFFSIVLLLQVTIVDKFFCLEKFYSENRTSVSATTAILCRILNQTIRQQPNKTGLLQSTFYDVSQIAKIFTLKFLKLCPW